MAKAKNMSGTAAAMEAAALSEQTEADGKTEGKQTVYTKSRLIASKRFRAYRDLLQVLLKDGEVYTMQQVEDTIRDFSGRKVGK